MTSVPLGAPAPSIVHPVPKLLLAAAVALVGDWLFYDHAPGISVVLFLAVVAAASLASSGLGRVSARGRRIGLSFLLLVAGLAPLVESFGLLSLASGVAGLALAVTVLNGGLEGSRRATAANAGRLLLRGPLNLVPDVYALARRVERERRLPRMTTVLGWLVPVALCATFAGLFYEANPLIEGWVLDIPWSALLPSFNLPRLLLWLLLLAFVWAFVAPRVRARSKAAAQTSIDRVAQPIGAVVESQLRPRVVLRCLMLFNLIFAVQSITDVAYLWAGFALPSGLTFAVYAHRGAYPLIVTALLAAAFVMVVLRPGGAGERLPVLRVLICVWIAQNVLLVISAMRRLDLYVEAYGLSVLRLSALIWMGVIAAGLALILVRIVLRRSNDWLVGANILTLTSTLYVCAFLNLPGLVADYNADRSIGTVQPFDIVYAMQLGAAAIPAIDRVLGDGSVRLSGRADDAAKFRLRQGAEQRQLLQDWRAWTFRDRRLLDYLEAHPRQTSLFQ